MTFNHGAQPIDGVVTLLRPDGTYRVRDLESGETVTAISTGGRLVLRKKIDGQGVWVVAVAPGS
jgi:hypothetical protein